MTTDLLNIEELNDQRDNNDLELRDLVYQTLERDGLITHLKAQLRAAVFKTIEKAAKPAVEASPKPSYDTVNGRLARGLVLDWLEHSNLLYTKDLLEVETPIGKGLDRESLIKELNLKSSDTTSCSLIEILLRKNSDQVKRNDFIYWILTFSLNSLFFYTLRYQYRYPNILKNRSTQIFLRKKLMIQHEFENIFVPCSKQTLTRLFWMRT